MWNMLRIRTVLSVVVIASLALPSLPLAGPGPMASIHGKILSSAPASAAGSAPPIAGALVRATDIASGQVYESALSDSTGVYSLKGLPEGSYALYVQSGGGVYLSDRTIGIKPGQDRLISFTLQPAVTQTEEKPASTGTAGDEKEKEKKKGGGYWSDHPWIAGLTVFGTAVGLGLLENELTDEEEEEEEPVASPSSP